MFLHIIPSSVLANRYHGAYKDVITRVTWLKTAYPDYQQALIDHDDPRQIADLLENVNTLKGALVEYSYHPALVKFLKQRFPASTVAVRAHNIEPLQHLGNHGWWPAKGPFWVAYGMARLAVMDAACKRWADHILCINDYEIDAYWRFIPGKANVTWLPYVCPEHLIPREPLPFEQRNIIACMPTSRMNRKSVDLVVRFQELASAMKREGSSYEFVVTGDLSSWRLPGSPYVRYAGMLDDLSGLLGKCRAVCLLSPLGYGYKTTMSDAFAAGAHVIAHGDLIRRMPAALRSYMLDAARPTLTSDLLQAPSKPTINLELQREAEYIMSSIW